MFYRKSCSSKPDSCERICVIFLSHIHFLIHIYRLPAFDSSDHLRPMQAEVLFQTFTWINPIQILSQCDMYPLCHELTNFRMEYYPFFYLIMIFYIKPVYHRVFSIGISLVIKLKLYRETLQKLIMRWLIMILENCTRMNVDGSAF